jgi:hypothetical protein
MFEDWILIAVLTCCVIQFIFSLQHFFSYKLIVYLVALTVVAAAIPNVLLGEVDSSQSLSVASFYMFITFITSSLMWDSRHFIIDTFSFREFLISRPVVIAAPVLIILVFLDYLPIKSQLCVWIAVVQILLAAALCETSYSVAKRNDWLIRHRRSSLPRMETISGNTPTNQTLV